MDFQVKGFLLQLPHRYARFSARGFFQINNETLTSMAGAVITYLVILIQFQTEQQPDQHIMYNLPNNLLWIIRLFGGLPLKCTSGTKNIKQLTFSLAGFVWSLTLFLLQEILCCIVLYMKIKGDTSNPGKNRTIRFAMILDVISLPLVTGATFFSGTWKYPTFIDVFSTFQRLYKGLHYMTGEVKIRE
ncbi:hypothetical protein J6590_073924 [Homalodisca vitripennis]|nr:hypothetical protein J6590_073924 [Homalodisca vitripennis]